MQNVNANVATPPFASCFPRVTLLLCLNALMPLGMQFISCFQLFFNFSLAEHKLARFKTHEKRAACVGSKQAKPQEKGVQVWLLLQLYFVCFIIVAPLYELSCLNCC